MSGADYSSNQTATAAQTVNLSIVNDNPVGIVPGFYNASTGGTAITQVTIPAGSSNSASAYGYVATPTTAGTYSIGGAVAGIGSWTSAVQTVTNPELRFSKSTVSVGKGLTTYYAEVYVEAYANGQAVNVATPVTVTLINPDPTHLSLPASVTIPAGQYYQYFSISGVDLTTTAATIDASASGYASPTTKLSASVVTPQLTFQGLDGQRSSTSARDDFYVQWSVSGADYSSNQTATAAQTVNLSIVNDNPVGIVPGFYNASTGGTAITQVTIPAGSSNSASAYGYVATPTTAGTYSIGGAVAGIGSWTSAVQTVTNPQLAFSSTSVIVGTGLNTYYAEVYVEQTVAGSAFNGSNDVVVNLSCDAATTCSVPATVTIPAGSYYAYFTVSGLSPGTTQIQASATGESSSAPLNVTVIAPLLQLQNLPTSMNVGDTANFYAHLHVNGASYADNQYPLSAMSIDLTSAAPGVASVPPSATIPTTSASSNAIVLTAAASGTTTITASAPSLTPVTSPTITVH